MNKQSGEKVKKLIEELVELQGDFEEQFDNLSERSQEGEKGEQLMSNIDSVLSAIDSLKELE